MEELSQLFAFSGYKVRHIRLEEDPNSPFKLIHRTLRHPTNFSYLEAAAEAVYQIRLK